MKSKKVTIELALFEDDFGDVKLRLQFVNSDRIIHSITYMINPMAFSALPYDILFEQAHAQLKAEVKKYYNIEMNKIFEAPSGI